MLVNVRSISEVNQAALVTVPLNATGTPVSKVNVPGSSSWPSTTKTAVCGMSSCSSQWRSVGSAAPVSYTRTVSEWNDAWNQAAQWGRNPSSDQMRRETVLIPLDLWRVYYYRSNAWTNPQSSDQGDDDGSSVGSDGNPVLPNVPDGIRIELTLPPGRALNGVMTVDWVNPLRSNSRS